LFGRLLGCEGEVPNCGPLNVPPFFDVALRLAEELPGSSDAVLMAAAAVLDMLFLRVTRWAGLMEPTVSEFGRDCDGREREVEWEVNESRCALVGRAVFISCSGKT